MKSSFDGLKKLQEKMKDLGDEGKQSVPLPELMSPEFMSRCSKFGSIQELFDSSGFKIDSAADFAAIPDEQWDNYIRTNTAYPSWMEMQKAAVADWTKRKLGLS
jgi:hypothetical protein